MDPRLCLFHNFYGYLDVSVSMRRWLKNCCGVVTRFERQRLAPGRLPSGKKRAGHHGTAQRPGGIGKNRSPSSCRRLSTSVLAAAGFEGRRCGKSEPSAGRWGCGGVGPGQGRLGAGLPAAARRARTIWLRQRSPNAASAKSCDRGGGCALRAVKSRNWPRPALSRSLQMGEAHPGP